MLEEVSGQREKIVGQGGGGTNSNQDDNSLALTHAPSIWPLSARGEMEVQQATFRGALAKEGTLHEEGNLTSRLLKNLKLNQAPLNLGNDSGPGGPTSSMGLGDKNYMGLGSTNLGGSIDLSVENGTTGGHPPSCPLLQGSNIHVSPLKPTRKWKRHARLGGRVSLSGF